VHEKKAPSLRRELLALLKRESTGAALSEVSRGGVLLSSAAASDLTAMMTSFRKQTYRRRIKQQLEEKKPLAKKVAAVAGAKRSTDHRPGKLSHTKVPKAGTMTYLRQPSMLKGRRSS